MANVTASKSSASSVKALEVSAFCFFEGEILSVNDQSNKFRLFHVLVAGQTVDPIYFVTGRNLIEFNKLTSVLHASVPLLIMNFVITLSNSCGSRGDSRVGPQTTLTML